MADRIKPNRFLKNSLPIKDLAKTSAAMTLLLSNVACSINISSEHLNTDTLYCIYAIGIVGIFTTALVVGVKEKLQERTESKEAAEKQRLKKSRQNNIYKAAVNQPKKSQAGMHYVNISDLPPEIPFLKMTSTPKDYTWELIQKRTHEKKAAEEAEVQRVTALERQRLIQEQSETAARQRRQQQEEQKEEQKKYAFFTKTSRLIVPVLESIKNNNLDIRNAKYKKLVIDYSDGIIELRWGNKLGITDEEKLIIKKKIPWPTPRVNEITDKDYNSIGFDIDTINEVISMYDYEKYMYDDREYKKYNVQQTTTNVIDATISMLKNPEHHLSGYHFHNQRDDDDFKTCWRWHNFLMSHSRPYVPPMQY